MSDEFGLRLSRVRNEAGLSIAELSARAHIPKSSIYAYESGRSEPKVSFAAAMADVLSVSLDYLVKGEVK